MGEVHYLADAIDRVAEQPARLPFSFDMTQPDANGNVLIDACVPLQIAIELMNLLALYGTTKD